MPFVFGTAEMGRPRVTEAGYISILDFSGVA